jgi:hypothetical protein
MAKIIAIKHRTWIGAAKYHRSEDIRTRLQTLYASCQDTLGAFATPHRVNDGQRKGCYGAP